MFPESFSSSLCAIISDKNFLLSGIPQNDAGLQCQSVDYVFLEVNKSFEQLTDLKAKDLLNN